MMTMTNEASKFDQSCASQQMLFSKFGQFKHRQIQGTIDVQALLIFVKKKQLTKNLDNEPVFLLLDHFVGEQK